MSETQQDFIEVFPDALSPEVCDAILEQFEKSTDAQRPGATGGGVNKDLKNSVDIMITGRPEWAELQQQLLNAVVKSFIGYVRKYPHTLLAPMLLQRRMPDGSMERITTEDIDKMGDQEMMQLIGAVVRPGTINVQRYTADEGGYPYWHCETMPKDASHETLHRHVLWTVYLNDGYTEGGTEFLYQDRLVEPQKGALLIAPAAFTHTHRGNMPKGGDKYIATSWLLFHRVEQQQQQQRR